MTLVIAYTKFFDDTRIKVKDMDQAWALVTKFMNNGYIPFNDTSTKMIPVHNVKYFEVVNS